MSLFHAWTVLHETGSADLALLLAVRTRQVMGPDARPGDAQELAAAHLDASYQAMRSTWSNGSRRFTAIWLVWWSCSDEAIVAFNANALAVDQMVAAHGLPETNQSLVDGTRFAFQQAVKQRQLALRDLLEADYRRYGHH